MNLGEQGGIEIPTVAGNGGTRNTQQYNTHNKDGAHFTETSNILLGLSSPSNSQQSELFQYSTDSQDENNNNNTVYNNLSNEDYSPNSKVSHQLLQLHHQQQRRRQQQQPFLHQLETNGYQKNPSPTGDNAGYKNNGSPMFQTNSLNSVSSSNNVYIVLKLSLTKNNSYQNYKHS